MPNKWRTTIAITLKVCHTSLGFVNQWSFDHCILNALEHCIFNAQTRVWRVWFAREQAEQKRLKERVKDSFIEALDWGNFTGLWWSECISHTKQYDTRWLLYRLEHRVEMSPDHPYELDTEPMSRFAPQMIIYLCRTNNTFHIHLWCMWNIRKRTC